MWIILKMTKENDIINLFGINFPFLSKHVSVSLPCNAAEPISNKPFFWSEPKSFFRLAEYSCCSPHRLVKSSHNVACMQPHCNILFWNLLFASFSFHIPPFLLLWFDPNPNNMIQILKKLWSTTTRSPRHSPPLAKSLLLLWRQ